MSYQLVRTFELHPLSDFHQILKLLKEFTKPNGKSEMSKNQTFENGFSKMLRQNFRQEKKICFFLYAIPLDEISLNPKFY